MNRIDRLTAMILMLQGRRVVTAEQIAEYFEISVRTVYRDIAALGEAGVPIIAEAGVGYALMKGYHMPPVMFTEAEAAALLTSSELAEKFGDDSLKKTMRSAMLKVQAALPEERRDYLGRLESAVNVMGPESGEGKDCRLLLLQEAVVRRRCLKLEYNTGGRNELSKRVVEPLGVTYYGRHWHLVAWCRMRTDFRDFRLDRISICEVLPEIFTGHEDFSFMDFLHDEIKDLELIPVTLVFENRSLDRALAEMPAQMVSRQALDD
ncbi:MAG: YafY family protein, partial [Verrucomicrobiota bacterium]